MSKAKPYIISLNDCSMVDSNGKCLEALRFLSENDMPLSVLHISPLLNKEPEPVISFNHKQHNWWSGRYIGSVRFAYKKQEYIVRISPRFGTPILMKMFSELFNIQFSSATSSLELDSESYYLKMLIAFIWLQKLSSCNRHGLPRINKLQRNISFNIKGRLIAGKSALSHKTTGKIISENRVKVFDPAIIKLLNQAYRILRSDFRLGELKIPSNAREAIITIEENVNEYYPVSQGEYETIRYMPIYQNFKEVVDFSWQIIKAKHGLNENEQRNNVQGFFLDMAEIWECFVRSHVVRILSPLGWHLVPSKYEVYPSCFFKRHLIPDIVMKKDNRLIVLDAKYKDMKFRGGDTDLDREDFFQIHAYISYLQSLGDVFIGGLVYPLVSDSKIDHTKYPLVPLFENKKSGTCFIAGGPIIDKDKNSIDFKDFEQKITHIAKTA
jgi:5-methylcytosine-specific restriction enzyme subunit McrC